VLEFSTQEQRILLTINRKDFFRLHRYGNLKHAGIVACAQDSNPGALAQKIHHAVRDLESCEGKFIKVFQNPPTTSSSFLVTPEPRSA
jgi:hypothetical protein